MIRRMTNLVIEDPFVDNNGLESAIKLLIMGIYRGETDFDL